MIRPLSTARRRLALAALVATAAAGALWVASVRQDNWLPPGPPEEAGRVLFERKKCVRCHRVGGAGGMAGPDLTAVAARRQPSWMTSYLIDPRAVKADARMPRPRVTDEQRAALVAYLATLHGDSIPAAPGGKSE